MALSTYAGTGTTLASSFYLRNFYSQNRDARTTTSRSHLSNSQLSSADTAALRKAVKELGKFSYDDDSTENIRNSVSAFVSTYNNLLDSASDSGDRKMQQSAKLLKDLTSKYSDNLDKIGITVNSDGTLETRSSLFSTASISKFEKLFSGDSDYMQGVSAYSKRLQKRSDTLNLIEETALRQKNQANAAKKEGVEMTQPDLNALLNTGIGANVNISL